MGRKLRVIRLCRQRLRPIERKEEVAVAVVGLTDLAPRGLVVIQNALRGRIHGLAQNGGLGIAIHGPEVLQAFAQRTELAQRIPAQVIFLDQLLHVFGGRTAGTRFKQPAAIHQLDDGQHLGRGAQFEDREEVRQIIAQHVACDRNAGLAFADCLERQARCLARGHDLERVGQASRSKRRRHHLDQFRIMGTGRVQPENGLTLLSRLTFNRQLDPVFDGRFARAGRAPDIARLDHMAV
mmetsp:Transcript_23331/g.40565  ORF Transcript_23331/g.40565 Transcript_23331/m.40565 type:complete len:238 (+) Transcript_23331:3920-4633(+)